MRRTFMKFFFLFLLLFLVNARIFGTLFLKLSPDLQNLNSKKMSVAKPDTQINHTFPFITVTSLFINWLFISWNVIFLVHRYICYMFIQFLMSRWQNFVVSEDCISGDKQSINQSKGINLSNCVRLFNVLYYTDLHYTLSTLNWQL